VKSKNDEQLAGLMQAYRRKKVRWADIELEKEIEKGFVVGGHKRKKFAFESDSEDDEKNKEGQKKRKPNAFLDRVKEEQRQFKFKLLAQKALERVQGEDNE